MEPYIHSFRSFSWRAQRQTYLYFFILRIKYIFRFIQYRSEQSLQFTLNLQLYRLLVLALVFHSFWCIRVKNLWAHKWDRVEIQTPQSIMYTVWMYAAVSLSVSNCMLCGVWRLLSEDAGLCVGFANMKLDNMSSLYNAKPRNQRERGQFT